MSVDGRAEHEHRRLVETLWCDARARSRNKNFYMFRDSPSYSRAVRAVRSLRALRDDMVQFRGASRLVVEGGGPGDRLRVTLHVPALRLQRSVFLLPFEVDLLRTDAALGSASDSVTRGCFPELYLSKTT